MGLFAKLARKRTKVNVSTAKIGQQVFFMNYAKEYGGVLGEYLTTQRLAELYLFRGWTAQFGYRIFSTNPDASETLIGEVVNSTHYLGLGMFEQTHGFSIESALGADYLTLIEDRWRVYDLIVSTWTGDGIPTMGLISVLTERLQIADAFVTYPLSINFLTQLDFIKRTALEIGVLEIKAKRSIH
jgi:hypothetical protein